MISSPYFEPVPLAELIEPAVIEATENTLPSLVPPYVDAAAQAAVQQLAVLLTGSTMSGPLFLSPLMPTQPSQAATMAYVDSMIATAGIPEVPPVPSGQVWARETGQWVPITPQTGVFLPLAGGIMTGNINMSGNTIQNMAAVPAMPNGAAPAQWVLNQIASVSLYQGTWDADTNTPDLTQLSTHVNAYTWIALTTAVGGVVIGPAIPGLQGMTIYNGDTIIYSTVQGAFTSIHAGGITLPEADARYVQLGGSQMSGPLLLNANASQPLQAVTYQQLEAFVPPGAVGEAPNDGQLYGRNGLTASWAPVLPLAGGILTGALTLAGDATANLNPVPLQQMTSAITAATAGYLPLAGAAMTGLMTLSGNASVGLNPVPLQQLTGMLASYAPLSGATFTGPVTLPTGSTIAGYLPLTGGTLTGNPAFTVSNATLAGYRLNNTAAGVTTGGLWRSYVDTNGLFAITQNTAAAGDFSTQSPWIMLSQSGLITLNSNVTSPGQVQAGTFQVNGDGISYPALNPGAHLIGFVWAPGLVCFVDGSNVGQIQFVSSDAALKENFAPISVDPLGVIDQIPLQQFDWKPSPWNRPHWSCGYVAQDIQPLIPEAVSGEAGNLGVDLMPMMAYCIGAIQQLSARVQALDGKTA